MAKEASRLDKGNKHPFSGQTVLFATKHEKEKLLSGLFEQIGMKVVSAPVDTDSLGTFSGEIQRKNSVRDTLRAKINLARRSRPGERFFLASEGSFGPHPQIHFIQSDLEALLFYDAERGAEIYEEYISTDVVHDKIEMGPRDDFRVFLKQNQFPSHGVLIRPAESHSPIFKGLHAQDQVEQAILDAFMTAENGRVVIATDLRAQHNPTRQRAIISAGEKLVSALKCLCPSCDYPGFKIVDGVPGLPCQACGEPSRIHMQVIYQCAACQHKEIKPRPDGISSVDEEECEYCNP